MRPLSPSAVGLTAAVLGFVVIDPAAAADPVLMNRVPTTQEFIDALTPQETIKTRGIGKKTVTEEAPAAAPAAPMAVDLPIVTFEFNSYELTPTARQTLDNLAGALKSGLASYEFVIEGHTDAVGADAYNQSLSERRAAAVRSYLVGQHQVDPSKLKAVGKGKRELLSDYAPNADIQRRVRIVNDGGGAG
jgi:OOP family OmpA-OmpF porin